MGTCALAFAGFSCRRKPLSASPDASTDSPTTVLTTKSATETLPEEPGDLTEPELIRFIEASAKIVSAARAQSIDVEPSGEGFARLNYAIQNREPFAAEIGKCGFTWGKWVTVGSSAWSAWSIAQVDYNAEAPLREQKSREAEARRRLAVAQETQRRGVWVLSETERVQRIEHAKDDQSSALRRADGWSHRAAELERQIDEAQSDARRAEAGGGPGASGQPDAPVDPFGPPPDRTFPPPVPRGPDPQAAQAALAYVEERRHEMELAHQHEAEERQRAQEAAAVIANPVVPAGQRERNALMSHAAKELQSATAVIDNVQAEQRRIMARLAEELLISRPERRKTASGKDIALLLKHLRDFNEAWGMKADGEPAL